MFCLISKTISNYLASQNVLKADYEGPRGRWGALVVELGDQVHIECFYRFWPDKMEKGMVVVGMKRLGRVFVLFLKIFEYLLNFVFFEKFTLSWRLTSPSNFLRIQSNLCRACSCSGILSVFFFFLKNGKQQIVFETKFWLIFHNLIANFWIFFILNSFWIKKKLFAIWSIISWQAASTLCPLCSEIKLAANSPRSAVGVGGNLFFTKCQNWKHKKLRLKQNFDKIFAIWMLFFNNFSFFKKN